MNKKNWMNLPNLLTSIRILLVPVLLAAFFGSPKDRQLPSLIIFLVAGLTDCIDGYIARKFNQITSLGKILDPIADKLLTTSTLLCLAWLKAINWVALGVIVVKEMYMAWGAAKCLRRKITIQADIYGKVATLLFYPAVILCWPWHGNLVLGSIGRVLIYISLVCSVVAAVHYTIDSVKKWNEIKAGMNAH
ncbi:MAG: CDP-diacylglycerol--glycerol-3-phosphate 3-phosphatidyltransferase [Clostridia bacterium]|nr:CDP-diacylglycerol--glycerol-3-phosphate 3-phosphatidyltransferase [Clostridia bacterium]